MHHKVILVGRVGQEPTMRYTQGGTAVTNMSVATTSRISKESTPECPQGWKESYNGRAWELTTWWRVTAWRKLAELCNQYLEKGRVVYIEGEVSGEANNGSQNPRVWTGSDGVPKASFEITARVVRFIGGRDEGQQQQGQQSSQEPPPGLPEEESIPF